VELENNLICIGSQRTPFANMINAPQTRPAD
jgi:hypothetical protein